MKNTKCGRYNIQIRQVIKLIESGMADGMESLMLSIMDDVGDPVGKGKKSEGEGYRSECRKKGL